MFSHQERLTRCHEVLQDAFDGQPSYFERGRDHTAWSADVVHPGEEKDIHIDLRLKPRGEILISFKAPKKPRVTNLLATYEEFASWVYGVSRLHGGQKWITPRHFVSLINDVFQPDPPLQHNPYHPHHQEFRLKGTLKLVFEWDTDECRLVAALWDNSGPRKGEGFRIPEDALGWLASVHSQIPND